MRTFFKLSSLNRQVGLLVLISSVINCAHAQDSSAPSTPAAPAALDVPRGNPLEGLFTPQPQYVTPQTLTNPQPQAPPAGELNPLKGLFTPQPQYHTPQALPNPDGLPIHGEANHLKSVFTPNNQFATPQTIINPQPTPSSFVPERQLLWGTDDDKARLMKHHNMLNFGVEDPEMHQRRLFEMREQFEKQQLLLKQQQESQKKTPQGAKQTQPKESHAQPKNSAANKLNAPQRQATTAPRPYLVPPPSPETALKPADSASTIKLREALNMVRVGKNNEALNVLNNLIKESPSNAQAHYVKATVLVQLRQYEAAQESYRSAIKFGNDEALIGLAERGLTKLRTKH